MHGYHASLYYLLLVMMERFLFLLMTAITVFIFSCKPEEKTVRSFYVVTGNPDSLIYMKAVQFKSLSPDYCSPFHYEITDLYPDMQKSNPATEDKMYLDDKLKENGFIQTGWGGGPSENGRVFELDFIKDSCKCSVFKIYREADTVKQLYRVVEQIVCNESASSVH